MDFQKKNRLMIWTIAILLIMNIATLALLWFSQFKRPKPFPPPGTQESSIEGVRFLEKELNLTEKQIQQFIDSRNRHATKSKEIHEKIYQLTKQILDEVFIPNPDSVKIQKLNNKIGKQQTEFERYLFKHILELKSYCNPEQQEKLKLFFYDVASMARPLKPHDPRLNQ